MPMTQQSFIQLNDLQKFLSGSFFANAGVDASKGQALGTSITQVSLKPAVTELTGGLFLPENRKRLLGITYNVVGLIVGIILVVLVVQGVVIKGIKK